MFLWLGFKGVRNVIVYSHPRIFLVAFAGYLSVGFGSIAFHATLKYPMQLVDELSMIYSTCAMLWASLSYSKSARFSQLLAVGLIGLAGFITVSLDHQDSRWSPCSRRYLPGLLPRYQGSDFSPKRLRGPDRYCVAEEHVRYGDATTASHRGSQCGSGQASGPKHVDFGGHGFVDPSSNIVQ